MVHARDVVKYQPKKVKRKGIPKGMNKFRIFWYIWERKSASRAEIIEHMSRWFTDKRDNGARQILDAFFDIGLLDLKKGGVYSIPDKRSVNYWEIFCKETRLRANLQFIQSEFKKFDLERIEDITFHMAFLNYTMSYEESLPLGKDERRMKDFERLLSDLVMLIERNAQARILEGVLHIQKDNKELRVLLDSYITMIYTYLTRTINQLQILDNEFTTDKRKAKIIESLKKLIKKKTFEASNTYRRII